MKYRGFDITKQFTNDIFNASRKKVEYGFRCRVFFTEDVYHQKIIDDFCVTEPKSLIADDDWESTAIINYIDTHYDELVMKGKSMDREKAYKMLCKTAAWIKEHCDEKEYLNFIKTAADVSKDEFESLLLFPSNN